MLYKKYLKRAFDFSVSLLAFIILLPVFISVMLLLSLSNMGSPFFFQRRPGKNERVFQVIKFKTMNDRRDKQGDLLPDEQRITRLGNFVRKTSLDEIPQLLNVIKGDMSLVGPRPLLVDYLPLYNNEQRRRHEVKPGITGWAQVNGRNAITWKQKFIFDVWYVQHMSFMLDLKILMMTVRKVFISEGISSSTSATMERFTGEV